MEGLGDLLKGYSVVKSTPKGALNERAGLIKFFADAVERPPRVVAIRLSHYSVSELYALKSGFSDRLTRNGREAAHKWFWWLSKTRKTPEARTATTNI